MAVHSPRWSCSKPLQGRYAIDSFPRTSGPGDHLRLHFDLRCDSTGERVVGCAAVDGRLRFDPSNVLDPMKDAARRDPDSDDPAGDPANIVVNLPVDPVRLGEVIREMQRIRPDRRLYGQPYHRAVARAIASRRLLLQEAERRALLASGESRADRERSLLRALVPRDADPHAQRRAFDELVASLWTRAGATIVDAALPLIPVELPAESTSRKAVWRDSTLTFALGGQRTAQVCSIRLYAGQAYYSGSCGDESLGLAGVITPEDILYVDLLQTAPGECVLYGFGEVDPRPRQGAVGSGGTVPHAPKAVPAPPAPPLVGEVDTGPAKLDPRKVMLLGPVVPLTRRGLASLEHLEHPTVGFSYSNDGPVAIDSSGAVVYWSRSGKLLRMRRDALALDASGGWHYPADASSNDTVIPTPRCEGSSLRSWYVKAGSDAVLYTCSISPGYWFDTEEKGEVARGAIHASNPNGLILATSYGRSAVGRLRVFDSKGDESWIPATPGGPHAVIHARFRGEGFMAAVRHGAAIEMWEVDMLKSDYGRGRAKGWAAHYARVTRRGVFMTPSGFVCELDHGKLDADGNLYSRCWPTERRPNDIVVMKISPASGLANIVASERAGNHRGPVVDLARSQLITGP
jgi:hypothetical protein